MIEFLALIPTILALVGMIAVYWVRWPYLSRTRRLEQHGYYLLLIVIIFGLIEAHFGQSRVRFYLIALAMTYLVVAFLITALKQRQGKRDDRR